MSRTVIKWILYSLCTIVLFALQSALGDRIAVYGIKPNLMPFLVCALAVSEGRNKGAWFGFFVGLLCDAFYADSACFFAILYFICGYGAGLLCEKYFSANFVTAALFGLAASVVSNFLLYVIFYMIFEQVSMADMGYIVGMEALYSLVLSVFAYLPIRFCDAVTRDRRTEYRKIRNRY